MTGARNFWPTLSRAEVRQQWAWRDAVRQQIVNTDIDGLLTAALLHETKGWPVVGFYDNETLWLSEEVTVPLDLTRTAWVDIDMSWPGARSISQHVVTVDSHHHLPDVEAHAETVNPNLFVGCSAGDPSRYRNKYPFGTFQWVAWIAAEPAPPPLEDALLTGLAWMPDGGFASVNHPSWRQNCLSWASETLPHSLLRPLATTSTVGARSLVQKAEAHLAGPRPLPGTWRNHQFVMSRRDGQLSPLIDVSTKSGLAETQRVLDAITDVYGWRRCVLNLMPNRFAGTWRTGRKLPRGWPASANDGGVVSFAVTGQQKYCWTEPENKAGLPALSEALC